MQKQADFLSMVNSIRLVTSLQSVSCFSWGDEGRDAGDPRREDGGREIKPQEQMSIAVFWSEAGIWRCWTSGHSWAQRSNNWCFTGKCESLFMASRTIFHLNPNFAKTLCSFLKLVAAKSSLCNEMCGGPASCYGPAWNFQIFHWALYVNHSLHYKNIILCLLYYVIC